jgi:hypothetical protein
MGLFFGALASLAAGVVLRSKYSNDDSVIQRITDRNWADLVNRSPDCFIFFHRDHSRVSDLAYLKYVQIVRKYRSAAQSFVASSNLTSFPWDLPIIAPSLFYIVSPKHAIPMLGAFSVPAVDRFIANHTSPKCANVSILDYTSVQELINSLDLDDRDESPILFVLSDSATRFGRVATQLSRTNSLSNRCYHLHDKKSGQIFHTRFPSLVSYSPEDGSMQTYDREPQLSNMTQWFTSLRPPSITRFGMDHLFDTNVTRQKVVVRFCPRSDTFAVRSEIVRESVRFPSIRFFYADPSDHPKLIRDLGYDQSIRQLCLLSNLSWIGHAPCDSPDDFERDSLNLSFLKTGREMYGYIAKLNERVFYDFLSVGSLFVIFSQRLAGRPRDTRTLAMEIAVAVGKAGSVSEWGVWEDSPFENQREFRTGSLWWFPSPDVSQAVEYKGDVRYAEMAKWVHGRAGDFDLAHVLGLEPPASARFCE